MPPDPAARHRAELILKVQAGQMTATAAAAALGVSRKTYYKWERRALQGMMRELRDQEPGRPAAAPDPKAQAFQAENAALKKQVEAMAQTTELRAVLRLMERKEAKKKPKPSSRCSRS